ncbi:MULTISPECIES: efflux RND transporter permease subunit [Mammaliicoccus]|uniref:efflux RND transporter permease subunit n=1 Tax=Mammaliicoccus TaxID=2803850 RepID=UPI00030149B3|nr:efflux RND transporter permease subunit [Mammaliicoccus vitulinus]PTI90996.1 AcrB/AcrD/AcrF family protein [Mammaliicoccus vitulinus]QQT14633.1 efflux RND transporter permease subunit [Mammaliicoccus vitulinus]QQY20068.1 efflux RND transporter permease subunit [Mammaliicoccus vitulinus]RTX91205.1 efflux RND transporter permease subunit [Mammaliicoccus vitulinus]GGI01101.1 multidrug transporter [Mammaliicoccus vitulinus]
MVQKMIKFSLNNKFAILLMTLIILLGGIYSAFKMKLELLPDVTTPVITVTTPYPGATPESVLENVTEPVEKEVQNLEGVQNVTSQSLENASAITLEYTYQTDMDEAETELKKKLEALKLPEGVEDPDMSRMSMYSFPVVSYSISDKNNDLEKATKQMQSDLIPKLEKVDGVQNVSLSGQTLEEVNLEFDQNELSKRGMTEDEVLQYIDGATKESPLGLYTFGDDLKSIVVDGRFTSIKALNDLEIPMTGGASSGGQQASQGDASQAQQGGQSSQSSGGEESSATQSIPSVKLSDIADVKKEKKRDSISKTNGKDALALQVTKATDANLVDVVDNVDKEVEAYKKDHKNIESVQLMETASTIKDSVSTMVEKALIGSIVAVIIIMFFLRDIKSTIIAMVSIPMSLLMALIGLKAMDVSLNILTLGALTVAIGRVIDDSIVVIENIYRRMTDKGETLKGSKLITSATKEMFIPIMSSTIVTIVVFLPLAFVTGQIGEMFRPFALAVAFSLLASLLIALTIVPVLSHMFFKNGIKKAKKEKGHWLAHKYKGILKWNLNHKWVVILLSLVLVVASIALVFTPYIGKSFIDTGEDKMLALTYKPSPGEKEEQVVKNGEQAEKYLSKDKNVEFVQYSVGGENPFNPSAKNDMALMVKYDKDTPDWDNVGKDVMDHIGAFNHKGEWKQQDFSTGGTANEVSVKVSGPTTDAIEGTVKDVEKEMKKVKGVENVSSNLSESYEQFDVKVDQNKASKLGLSAGQIAMTLNQTTQNKVVTKLNDDGKSIDVKLTKKEETDWSEDKLENTKITSPLGKDVKLSDIATLEKTTSPDTITRENDKISVSVDAKITADDVAKVTTDVNQKVSKVDTPAGVDLNVGGTNDDINEAIEQLVLAMAAAILIVYLVIVLTFKGGLAPFSILFSLPVSIIGVIAGLLVTQETISVPSMIGMLMLIGIVVTNAIVLIDRVINMEQAGMSTREALIEAAGTRLRPILMTALATIGALVPLLFGGGSSVLISKALAITVIGGLVSSTILTLLVVPITYEIIMKFKKKIFKSPKEQID